MDSSAPDWKQARIQDDPSRSFASQKCGKLCFAAIVYSDEESPSRILWKKMLAPLFQDASTPPYSPSFLALHDRFILRPERKSNTHGCRVNQERQDGSSLDTARLTSNSEVSLAVVSVTTSLLFSKPLRASQHAETLIEHQQPS